MNELVKDYKMQGASMMGVENFEKAKEFFEKAIEIEPSAELYMDLGNAHASMSDYNKAVDAFSKALLLEPNNGEILFNIGSVYLLQTRLKKCIQYYNKAEVAGFKNVRLYMNLAAIYKSLGDSKMELRNYTKAIEENPLIGDMYVNKVMLLIKLHRYPEALETLDDMRSLFPDAFEGYDLAARIYAGQGDNDNAIKILDEGISKFPKDVNLRLSKINIYVENRDSDNAEKVLQEIKESEYADAFNKAIMMQEVSIASIKNQPEKMKDLLVDIVKMEDEKCDEQSRYMLMMTCMLLKDYDIALEMADVLEEQDTKSIFVVSGLYYKGEILKNIGKLDESKEQFIKATKKLRVLSMSNQTFYECYLYRALAHKAIKEYDKAIELADYIKNLQPERADGYVILADIYKEMGETQKSEEQFKIAQEKDQNLKRK